MPAIVGVVGVVRPVVATLIVLLLWAASCTASVTIMRGTKAVTKLRADTRRPLVSMQVLDQTLGGAQKTLLPIKPSYARACRDAAGPHDRATDPSQGATPLVSCERHWRPSSGFSRRTPDAKKVAPTPNRPVRAAVVGGCRESDALLRRRFRVAAADVVRARRGVKIDPWFRRHGRLSRSGQGTPRA